jgi:aconitate hydratase
MSSTHTAIYFMAQGIFGAPGKGEIEYSSLVELDLAEVEPGVAGA